MYIACATDGTKLLVEFICETVLKSLFWALLCNKIRVCVMLGLLKMSLLICKSG